MATIAMVATAAITVPSMMTMNHAARLAASGEGWVIPMVLMKAFAMMRMSFMVPDSSMTDWDDRSRTGGAGFSALGESQGYETHLIG
jgi:hypothetical protein